MTPLEGTAAGIGAGVMVLAALIRRQRRSPSRGARFVLWLAIAAPLPFLLLTPTDRPQLVVHGPGGAFGALPLLAFAAAGAGIVGTLRPAVRRPLATVALVALACTVALGVAIGVIR